MNRRSFLTMLAALPGLGWIKPTEEIARFDCGPGVIDTFAPASREDVDRAIAFLDQWIVTSVELDPETFAQSVWARSYDGAQRVHFTHGNIWELEPGDTFTLTDA